MKKQIKALAFFTLALSILCSTVYAAEYTNKYISSAEAYIHVAGNGKISVEYTVTGTYVMDEIGAHRVTVYRMLGDKPDAGRDDIVQDFYYTNYPDMMGKGGIMYYHAIDLTVTSGEKYYATFTFYASLDGGGDEMPFSTYVVTA